MTTLQRWLEEAPFSLALSAGFFGFFAHAGTLAALLERGLRPARVSGASAGALVGGLWAAGLTPGELRHELFALKREDFWDPAPGFGLLRGRLFRKRLERLLPVTSFENCRVPASLSVYDVFSRRTRVLSQGPLAPAIQASCTLPGLFHPLWHDGRPLLDGGILDRPALHGVQHDERVLLHHLASRSPWRKKGSAALRPPRRGNLVALVAHGLPRVSPFRLEQGQLAFESARRATTHALDERPSNGVVSIGEPR